MRVTYNLVGIDTIRFSVSQDGFNRWLGKQGFTKVKVDKTLLTSRTLKKKLEKDKSIRVVKINSSYPNKLSNYLVIGKAKREDHYNIEIAGLHQPTNGLIAKGTYEVVAKLLNKYVIESVDYATDFLAVSRDVMHDRRSIARALSSEISGRYGATTYFSIGADYSSQEPMGAVWQRDTVLYWKALKERTKGVLELNNLWYRLELRVDNNPSGFRIPQHTKPKAWNKSFLMELRDSLEETPIVDAIRSLAQTDIDYKFLAEQLKYFFEGRSLRHYKG